MSARLDAPLRVAAVAAASALVGISFLPAASAADGDVEVVNTETIQVYTDASGKVQTKRVYEQVSMTGNGSVDLVNPIETDGLRNLDEFGGFDVRDGNQVTTRTVDGEERLRSVSDYDGELPLTVDVQYFLDGTKVEPGDVVGADGRLEVLYTVTNVTAQPQEVSFPDGNGGTVTKTVDVPIPMVGSLSTVAPDNFTDVQSDQANMAGDGRGGTKLSFTMTLFPPLGSDSVEFGYSATITDGVVPRAEISALPLNPLESPTFQTAATSYQSGADTGAQLADGAATIDQNLLKLRDGASELLAGLIRLRDGSEQLEQGLAGEAAPGAALLADGAAQLSAGLGEIDAGAGRLADGTTELLAGTGELMSGAGRLNDGAAELASGAGAAAKGGRDLADGAGQLDAGLTELDGGVGELSAGAAQLSAGQEQLEEGLETLYEGVNALPASVQAKVFADPNYQRLVGTLSKIIAGIGGPNDLSRDTLLGGLNLLELGLDNPNFVPANCDQDPTDDGADPREALDNCGASEGLTIIAGKMRDGVEKTETKLLPASLGAYQALTLTAACPAIDGVTGLPPLHLLRRADTDPCKAAAVSVYGYGLPAGVLPDFTGFADGGFIAQSTLASGKLSLISSKLSGDAVAGIAGLRKALYNSACNPAQTDKTAGDYCGISQALSLIQAGVPTLVGEITSGIRTELLAGIGTPTGVCDPDAPTLLCGAGALTDGGQQLAAGVSKLADGVVQLSEGGSQLSAGAEELAAGLTRLDAGAGKLAAGTGELKDGAKKLNDGAGRLNDGAGQLADGTGQAKDGAEQISEGAGELAQGLGEAANGSSRITDGLETAAEGAPKLVDGAERLSNEGTKKLVEAGVDTTQTYGQMYATIAAGAERAEAEKMAYGAPEGAMGLTAYSFVIEGEDGEGGRNLARGLAGLAVLGAGAGAFALRRRFI